jgi:hypothetical protein
MKIEFIVIDKHSLVSSCQICQRQWIAKQIKNEWCLLRFCKHLSHVNDGQFVLAKRRIYKDEFNSKRGG